MVLGAWCFGFGSDRVLQTHFGFFLRSGVSRKWCRSSPMANHLRRFGVVVTIWIEILLRPRRSRRSFIYNPTHIHSVHRQSFRSSAIDVTSHHALNEKHFMSTCKARHNPCKPTTLIPQSASATIPSTLYQTMIDGLLRAKVCYKLASTA